MLEHSLRIVYMLDRLKEYDGVTRAELAEVLDHAALESEVGRAVAELRVFVRFKIGIQPDDAARAAGKHVRAVTLATGHVQYALTGHTPGDPFVHGQMPPEPIVLLRNVGEGPLTRQR